MLTLNYKKLRKETGMKKFFKDNDFYTKEASSLVQEVQDKLTPLFDKYQDEGYLTREIYFLMDQALVSAHCCAMVKEGAKRAEEALKEHKERKK
jgi:hypothetical protein